MIVFGDHNNDIEMFQIADSAIALANATVELKRHTIHVINSNQTDSVVRYIHQDWTQRSLLKLV